MNITVNEDRTVQKEYNENEGSQNENRITELSFTLPTIYSDFVHKIVFITEDGNYSDYIEDGKYILKNNITKYRKVKSFVWLTDSNANKDFRSEVFPLEFNYNEDPSDYMPSEEEKSQIELLIDQLDELIEEVESLPSMHREIVEELPTTDIDPSVIYMILREDSEPNNIYDEWLYINDAWEKIGSTDTDLSDYYTKTQADNKFVDKVAGKGLSTNDYTTAEKNKLAGIDLTDYVKNTDYANGTTAGVFKTSSGYGTEVSTSGFLRGIARSYSDYGNADTATIISKGTLDNVLTAVVGDISTILQELDTGSGV